MAAVLVLVGAVAAASAQPTAEYYVTQGDTAEKSGAHDRAIQYYTEALKRDPSLVAVYHKRGLARSRSGDFAGAIGDYDRYLAANPRAAVALGDRCYAKVQADDADGALADCTSALAASGDQETPARRAWTYLHRARAWSRKKDFTASVADLTEAVRLSPKWADAYNNRGIARSNDNDVDGAIADYDTAISLRPSYAVGYNNRGVAKAKKGDLRGALADYRKALEIQADYALARRNLDRLMKRMAGEGAPPPLPADVKPPDADAGPPTLPAGPPPLPAGPPPLPAPAASPAVAPVRAGDAVPEPKKIKHVDAVYPKDAAQARVTGVVVLECIIQPDGTVGGVKVLRSIPPLDAAAIAAVTQWVYEPTMLNGLPVSVATTVTVNFALK